MMREAYGVTEANWRDAITKNPHFEISENLAFVCRAVAALAADPNASRWNGQSLSNGQLAKNLWLQRSRRQPARCLVHKTMSCTRAAGRIALRQSNPRSAVCGMTGQPMTTAASEKGTLAQNTQRRQRHSASQGAMLTPTA
jgi:hypothetical protein